MSKQSHWMNASTQSYRHAKPVYSEFLSFLCGGPMAPMGTLFSSILCTSLTGIFCVYVINGK